MTAADVLLSSGLITQNLVESVEQAAAECRNGGQSVAVTSSEKRTAPVLASEQENSS